MTTFDDFIYSKSQLDGNFGFDPSFMPDVMFDFQAHMTEWAINKGRGALFADCGLGKTLMEMVWAQNVYIETGKPVLILTPLAVAQQFVTEGEKFSIEVARSRAGEITAPLMVANYERLHLFDSSKFGGVVCDESSILKNFNGVRKAQITEFVRLHKYRLLATATAAPNDYTELGTSSEALGYLGYMDMLGQFFTNKQKTSHGMNGRWRDNDAKWRFRGYAEGKFWRWVSSWARALRTPSDLGFDDNGFVLPELIVNRHTIKPNSPPPGMLFALPAVGLRDQGQERRRTITERCELAAALVEHKKQSVIWCHYNKEGDLLEKLIPGAVQVSGKDNDDKKERKFESFTSGETRVLITKPKIGAWGLNWQQCNHTVYFPSHSYEQYYQAVRRMWRFGQENKVTVDIIGTEGEQQIMDNLKKKEDAAVKMFDELVAHMNNSLSIQRLNEYNNKMEIPSWL